ncbi:hypothetical protein, partial [Mesorhizobium sp. M4B.F.Ca.ET.169.01.1.1]|uniref:hypothetical protein n=1 Tax=Mesorhizobium sp. M4B.F.Ca.ET.169.01.1.1 TaxID=2563949 RepID=UPI001AEE52F6
MRAEMSTPWLPIAIRATATSRHESKFVLALATSGHQAIPDIRVHRLVMMHIAGEQAPLRL